MEEQELRTALNNYYNGDNSDYYLEELVAIISYGFSEKSNLINIIDKINSIDSLNMFLPGNYTLYDYEDFINNEIFIKYLYSENFKNMVNEDIKESFINLYISFKNFEKGPEKVLCLKEFNLFKDIILERGDLYDYVLQLDDSGEGLLDIINNFNDYVAQEYLENFLSHYRKSILKELK